MNFIAVNFGGLNTERQVNLWNSLIDVKCIEVIACFGIRFVFIISMHGYDKKKPKTERVQYKLPAS